MVEYVVHPVQICCDRSRSNGWYYAKVHMEVFEDPHQRKIPTRSVNLEVILNGAGVNKAYEKVQKELRVRGFPYQLRREIILPLEE